MATPTHILALDQGTTSSRAIVYDQQGQIVSVAQKEFQQFYPQPGWVEHDPMEIWSSQSSVTAEAVSRANLDAGDIAAVGITNQRETTLVWDRETGRPIHPAIVWQDRRTAAACKRLSDEGIEGMFREKTGLRLDPYFSGTKLAWILDHVDGAREKARAGKLLFGTVDSWLVWKFTEGGAHITDVTNASRTLLFNIHTLDWDDALLEALDIPRAMLPEVRGCSEVYGHISGDMFPRNVPIAGIAGDQQAALFGQGCFSRGMAKNTYGTGCFMLMNTAGEAIPSKNNLLTTVAWKIGDEVEYALEGSIFVAGAVVQWLRDELGVVRSAEECSALAANADNGGVYLVPAFAGLGAPHWDPNARGAIFGLTRGANRANLCRAALEAIAFQSADLISSMEADSGIALKQLAVDGGAARSEPLMQFQADLLQVPVVRPKSIETTAMGAAFLAGLAVGFWKDRADIAGNWAEDKRFEPTMDAAKREALLANWAEAVSRAKAWERG